ncbi:MAG: hypothetical protein KKF46_01650 [Nanoarchaeota archaeon]|nr:hypothetical protein [Nanoarchaeota archaeon]MBU1321036.1 hypothetical protein [Nanoarchaeota archaeon]MBU1598450.1 hypothetical protein [Nanoarchaeota archaeon]MBU2441376.1 hypothetical protein [Nanoarchaeota archaeon]
MKKIIFVLMILSLLFLSSCFREIPLEEVNQCEFDAQCIQVDTAGCCKCPASINKDYEEYWQKYSQKLSIGCEGAECKMCGPKPLGAICQDNQCELIYSPVGQ